MTIAIWNKKGGVGKSSIAFNLAKDLKEIYFLFTNDDSTIEDIYPDKSKIFTTQEELPLIEEENIIYDLGGFIDDNVLNVLKFVDLIIIPTNGDINSLKRTTSLITELKEDYGISDKVIVLGNNISDEEDFKSIFPNELIIPQSKLIQKTVKTGESINEHCVSKFRKHIYRNLLLHWDNFLNRVQGVNNGK